MINILAADDHAIFRQGLRRLIDFAPDMALVEEAKSGSEVLECLRTGSYDILLLDLSMPSPNGVDLVRRAHARAPQLPILVLTVHDETELASRVIRAGAAGYVTKDSEPESLLAAIRSVARGGHFIAQSVAAKLVYETAQEACPPHRLLSDREYQVLLQLAAGRCLRDIAEALTISPKTVGTHKFRIMHKLGLHSESDLVRYAIRHGLAEPVEPGLE